MLYWSRWALKSRARKDLRQYFWKALGVSVPGNLLLCLDMSVSAPVLPGIPGLLVGLLVGAAVFAFFAGPVRVGIKTFYMSAPRGDTRFGILFSSFGQGRYLAIVKAMFVKELTVFLWSLLLVVPGVIKHYQYSMVPYIISDSPYLTPRQAKAVSRAMTAGQKWWMFVLDLSFFFWVPAAALLCAIVLPLLSSYYVLAFWILYVIALVLICVFLPPYIEVCWAQLYSRLRHRAAVPPPPR